MIYVSDNGLFFGEHRIPSGKGIPYAPALRVPMAIYAGAEALGQKPVGRLRETISNVDIAPTFLDLANAPACTEAGACRTMDGRSLASLLRGGDPDWPQDRHLLVEVREECRPGRRAVQNSRYLYLEQWKKIEGECRQAGRELYDNSKDPYQLTNLLAKKPTRRG